MAARFAETKQNKATKKDVFLTRGKFLEYCGMVQKLPEFREAQNE